MTTVGTDPLPTHPLSPTVWSVMVPQDPAQEKTDSFLCPAESDDLAILKHEARRRGVSLGALLKEMVEREAAAIRSSHRPRIGVVNRPVSVAAAMSDDTEAALRSDFRTS